jgi:hypothetical protein
MVRCRRFIELIERDGVTANVRAIGQRAPRRAAVDRA